MYKKCAKKMKSFVYTVHSLVLEFTHTGDNQLLLIILSIHPFTHLSIQMDVYMRVCLHACMLHVHVCMRIYACVHMHVCACMCTHACVYMHVCTCMRECMPVWMCERHTFTVSDFSSKL